MPGARSPLRRFSRIRVDTGHRRDDRGLWSRRADCRGTGGGAAAGGFAAVAAASRSSSVTHAGNGKPWVTVQANAAIPSPRRCRAASGSRARCCPSSNGKRAAGAAATCCASVSRWRRSPTRPGWWSTTRCRPGDHPRQRPRRASPAAGPGGARRAGVAGVRGAALRGLPGLLPVRPQGPLDARVHAATQQGGPSSCRQPGSKPCTRRRCSASCRTRRSPSRCRDSQRTR